MKQESGDSSVEKQPNDSGRSGVVRQVLGGIFILVIGVLIGQGTISFSPKSAAPSKLPAELDYSSVDKVYQALRSNYDGDVTAKQLIEGMKEGLAEATKDPYTEYFTAKEAQDFDNQLNNTFSGIGAELSKDKNGNIIVIAPIKGFPAAKAGLQAKDIITAVDGTSTQGYSVEKAVSVIRGKKGTTVKLQIVRGDKQLNLAIVRANIKVPSVTTEILPGNIGYIQVSTFGDDTASLIDDAAQDFASKNVSGVILDLRGNPGGLLSAAVDVSSQWLPEGKLVLQEKRGDQVIDSYRSRGSHPLEGVPTVVLINGGSASASEITAGALHDNKAAYLIGEKSFGKGVVQKLVSLSDGSELKVTVASWYRPNGQNINKQGISPDKTVKFTQLNADQDTDPQLDAAKAYLKNR